MPQQRLPQLPPNTRPAAPVSSTQKGVEMCLWQNMAQALHPQQMEQAECPHSRGQLLKIQI